MYKLVLNIFLALFLLLMVFSLTKVVSGKAQEEININKLKSLVTTRIHLNNQLKTDYYYFTSDEYIQKVSREQLNLAQKDEFKVVLPFTLIKKDANKIK